MYVICCSIMFHSPFAVTSWTCLHTRIPLSHGSALMYGYKSCFTPAQKVIESCAWWREEGEQNTTLGLRAVPLTPSEPRPPKSPGDFQAINPEDTGFRMESAKEAVCPRQKVDKATLLGALKKTGTSPMAPAWERGSPSRASDWRKPGSNGSKHCAGSHMAWPYQSIMAYLISSLFAYGVLKV